MSVQRDALGRLTAGGPSLNPGGRPRTTFSEDIRQAMRNGRELWEFWRGVKDDPDARNADRLRASELLAEYAFGKPTQHVESQSVSVRVEGRVPLDLSAFDIDELEMLGKLQVKGAPAAFTAGEVIDGEIVPVTPAAEPLEPKTVIDHIRKAAAR